MANDCLFPDWQALLYVHVSAPGSHADGRDVTWGPSNIGKMKKQRGRPPRWHYKEWCLKCLARSFTSLDILGLVDFLWIVRKCYHMEIQECLSLSWRSGCESPESSTWSSPASQLCLHPRGLYPSQAREPQLASLLLSEVLFPWALS